MNKGKNFPVGLAVVFAGLAAFWFGVYPASSQEETEHPMARIRGRYSFRMTPVKSFSADATGVVVSPVDPPRQDILRVGVFTVADEGNIAGHTIATTDTNNGETWIVEFNWTGKYAVNPDGTGFFSVDEVDFVACTKMTVGHTGDTPHPVAQGGAPFRGNVTCPTGEDAPEGHEDYAFVFTTRGGKRIEFIQTDNDGGGAKIFLTGVATAHESFGPQDEALEGESQEGQEGGRGDDPPGGGRGRKDD